MHLSALLHLLCCAGARAWEWRRGAPVFSQLRGAVFGRVAPRRRLHPLRPGSRTRAQAAAKLGGAGHGLCAQSEAYRAATQRRKRGPVSAARRWLGADARRWHGAAVLGLVTHAAHRDAPPDVWWHCGAECGGIHSHEVPVGTKRTEEEEDTEKGEGVHRGWTDEASVERLCVESSRSDMNGQEG